MRKAVVRLFVQDDDVEMFPDRLLLPRDHDSLFYDASQRSSLIHKGKIGPRLQ